MKRIHIFLVGVGLIITSVIISAFVSWNLTARDHINVQTQSELYNFSLSDGQVVSVYGVSSMGDIPIKFYYWDAASSATDDGEDVIKPTAVMGNGRFLKIQQDPPISTILLIADDALPIGYLWADGSAVSRTTYANLFNKIGTTYGTGDGSTTFNLPDVRQRFPLFKGTSGTGSSLGDTGGDIDHVHTVDPPNTTSGSPSSTVAATILAGGAASTDHTHDVNISQFNSGEENPPFITFNGIIKY